MMYRYEYKKVFKCEEFADSLSKEIDEQGINYKKMIVTSVRYVYSDKYGGIISENEIHYAVKVGDVIYDNLTLDGMNYSEWKIDLGIGIYPGITCNPID